MPDIKLFSTTGSVKEIPATVVALERELQTLIEQNMPALFGVTFLQSEFVTSHGGRIDSLGIDENHCPVIFEYKRSSNETVINQGLFYLDWLMNHKADFELLVMNKLGKDRSDLLDWSVPRLICVANNFTKYDEYAVNQINRNIDLVRYIKFGDELILFEMVNSKTATQQKPVQSGSTPSKKKQADKTFEEQLGSATTHINTLYESARDFILSLGDDINQNTLKLYTTFKKMKNVICLEAHNQHLTLYLKLDPGTVHLEKGFTRDVSNIGHWGTGDLELIIKTDMDFEKAKPLLQRAYDEN